MRLTRYEFRKKTEASDLSIAFIGMSNAGKSRSAQLLKRDAKFSVFSVDAFIQNQLSIDNIDQVAD